MKSETAGYLATLFSGISTGMLLSVIIHLVVK